MNLTHLFMESHYSMSGSNISFPSLIRKAKELGFSSLALTDQKMHGVIDFYKACLEEKINPIIGLQVPVEGVNKDSKNLCLLYAKDKNGYHNLLKLSSLESYNSVVTLSDLKKYKKGIIAIYMSDNSELYEYFTGGKRNEFLEVITSLNSIFDEYMISVSKDHNFNQFFEDKKILVDVSKVMYLNETDIVAYNTLKSIFNKSTDTIFQEDIKMHFRTVEKNIDYPNASNNIEHITNTCRVEIDFNQTFLPHYPVKNNRTPKEYLRALTEKGLDKRLKGRNVNRSEYVDRINYELKVIDTMGYNDYFLIVWDFVKYAKSKHYLVGPGRGSAAASLVSYCLGITSIDSIQYDLVFERFLNPARISLPDIDIDLPDDKRDDVIQYVKNFYGKDRVASICTFGTFQAKSAIRDVARILEIDGMLLKQVVSHMEDKTSIQSVLEKNKELKNLVEKDARAKDLVETAMLIEGLNRNISTHAAGIIVGADPIVSHTAIRPGLNDMYQTQYEMGVLESLGLLKIDFLGLRNLSSIDSIVRLIEQNEGKKIDIYSVPMDDKKTFELLRKVETVGVFQLESQGMKSLIGQMEMREFEDIVAVLALFRPGPMENIPAYIRRRHGKEKVTYPHPVLEEVLKSTNGIIVYQEQILKIASLFAGYSYGEADVLRRAVSKKQLDVLENEREHFVSASLKNGHNKNVSNEIYDYIVKFSNYGFNRAHSVAYGVVAYWMAYLKANYPTYFISVLTSSVIGSEANTRNYIYEAYKLNVRIIPASVNISSEIYEPKEDALVFPLLGIKNVGRKNVANLIEEREKGKFTSFVDFVSRTNMFLNKRVLESLIKASALDEFGLSKRTMIERLEDVVNFSNLGEFIKSDEFVLDQEKEYPFATLEAFEKEVLGFNLQYSPLSKHLEYIEKHKLLVPSTISTDYLGKEVRVMAVLSFVRKIKTKNNNEMAFITLQDSYSKIDGVLFASTYAVYKDELARNDVYLFKGRIDERNGTIQLVIDKVHRMED